MSAVVHGGVTDAELADYASRGITLVDLSASLNPYGPHPAVVAAAQAAVVARYPEPDAATLRTAYARACDIAPEMVVAGNGSSELLYLAMRAFAGAGRGVLLAGPTFGEYAAAAVASGACVEEVRANEADDFAIDVDALCARIAATRPAVTVLCNPNNPTGRLVARANIEYITKAVTDAGGVLLVDEAYGDFAFPRDERSQPAAGCVVIRSLTKLHAIPGLRLGFALGEPDAIAAISALLPPWAVSTPALAAGMQALREPAFAQESRERTAVARESLVSSLSDAGFRMIPGSANFVLVKVDDAAAFRGRLMEHGFVVRDCSSFGLSGHVRVAVPRTDQVSSLADAMAACR